MPLGGAEEGPRRGAALGGPLGLGVVIGIESTRANERGRRLPEAAADDGDLSPDGSVVEGNNTPDPRDE